MKISKNPEKKEMIVEGVAASSGVVIGEVHLHTPEVDVTRYVIDPRKVEEEITRFEEALNKCKTDLAKLKENVGLKISELGADIFETHLMLIQDPLLITEVTENIRRKRVNSEYALLETIEKFKKKFSEIEDEYIRERAVDIQDVGIRILKILTKWEESTKIKTPSLIVAHDLTPSDTIGMDRSMILGFATDVGSRTSHTAIIGRSLGIPAVVGLKWISVYAKPGETIIIDGDSGIVILNPTKKTINSYIKRLYEYQEKDRRLITLKDKPAITLDGVKINLLANVENAKEIPKAIEIGAGGVGLFRTEYIFLERRTMPDEDEQFKEYKRAVKLSKNRPLVIRTIDVGGDKIFKDGLFIKEQNPFLGMRAIRFSLSKKDFFITQLRAILRAAEKGNIKIMFPMISCLDELREAKKCLNKAKKELSIKKHIDVGIMIEIPAAALIAKHLAKEVDFFSIGTNDLLQYSLAVDRGNETVAHLYKPLHPANLILIKQVISAAVEADIELSLCGEMASEIEFVPLLIGLGLRTFSMSRGSILDIKNIIMHVNIADIEKNINRILELPDAGSVKKEIDKIMKPIMKELKFKKHK